MKSQSLLFILSAILFVAFATSQELQVNPTECVTDWVAGSTKDYFPQKLDALPALGFRVKYFGNYKIVENLSANETYLLYLCGSLPPANSTLPANTKVFKIPLESLAVTDTTILTFLEVLGVSSRVHQVDLTYVNSPCLIKRQEISNITNFNFYSSAAQTLEAVKKVDGVLSGPSINAHPKYIAFSASSDPGNLNRAAWLGFLSTFFNLEGKANQLFDAISNNYECYEAKLSSAKTSPVVFWVSYSRPASWNGNKGSWSVSSARYKLELTTDAGGVYKEVDATYTSFDAFQTTLLQQNAEILVDETYAPTLNETTFEVFRQNFPFSSNLTFPFLKNQNVFRTDKTVNRNMGLAWYESSIVLADEVLQDFISVVHPEVVPATYQRKWFRNVSKNEPIIVSSSSLCSDIQAPYLLKNESCYTAPSPSPSPSLSTPQPTPEISSSAMPFQTLSCLLLIVVSCAFFLI